jgi:cyanophycin synthetase
VNPIHFHSINRRHDFPNEKGNYLFMKIVDIKVMRGPNLWSNYRKKLIVLKLDLGIYEQYPTNLIDGFGMRLQKMLPSLYEHRCSPGVKGGFFERVKEGTWLGHVIEHIALELQSLAGMECGFGRTRSTGKTGVYNVVFSYEFEKAGVLAARRSVELVESILNKTPFDLQAAIDELARINRRERFGPSTQSILDEAEKRNIPYTRLDQQSLIMLGYGNRQKLILATVAGTTSSIGVDLAANKAKTKRILGEAFIPVPKGVVVEDVEELEAAIEELGFPLVLKPLDGNHGRGITTNITTKDQAVNAFMIAKNISRDVIAERFITGQDYRFLLVNYKLVAVAKRTPAMIMGDGKSTIAELIEETNKDPRRGNGHENTLTKITVDEITENILSEKKLALTSVLPLGEILFLKDTANISTGGTARDLTDRVHPHNVFLAERIARLMHLDICGIDIIAQDIDKPITEKNGAVLEVNAGPGFRMHHSPTKGLARNVAEPVIEMLFPNNAPSRIPITAVTGTNGKTTTVRLIAHLAACNGHHTGYTTTEGIYINGVAIYHGDCSGPASAAAVLRDPLVDFAVLECARGGILRSGLGFDQCDIGIVTNVTEDHIGLGGIDTLEDLAKVKAVVPSSVHENGYAILNADDYLVYNMCRSLDCKIALFSMDAESERIKKHCDKGGLAMIIEKGYLTLCKGIWKTRIIKVEDIPLTFSGTAECMIKNVLPSALAAYISGFSLETISSGLRSFIPSPETTPGRMNIFQFKDFKFMLDYSHNTDAYIQLKKYLSTVEASVKIGVIAATGDRRDEDIRSIGYYAAQIFDEIIIRHDVDGRGRSKENQTELLLEGIHQVSPDKPVKVISDEFEALQYAADHAPANAFVFACADHVHTSIEFVKQLQEQSLNGKTLQPVTSKK